MRGWAVLFILAASLAAQQTAPLGVVEGTLLERDPTGSGELTVRLKDNHVYCFAFDTRTYVEKDSQRAAVADLRKGDTLEIVSDQGARPQQRYARIVKVMTSLPVTQPLRSRLRPRAAAGFWDDLFPRGDLTFAGVVARVSQDMLVLRTRAKGELRLLLRSDTRYVQDGVPVDVSVLSVNTRVFVRGGRNLDEDIEAYQVMWGEIFKPE